MRPLNGANTQACTGKLVFEGKLDEPNRGDVLFENLEGEAACYEPMSSVKGSAIQYCLLVLEREGDVGAISSSMLVGNCGLLHVWLVDTIINKLLKNLNSNQGQVADEACQV